MTITVHQLLDKKGGDIYSIDPDSSVYDAIKMMSELKVGALLVIKEGQLKGIISERDYTRKIILKDRSSKTSKVEDIMTNKVICIGPDKNIEDCMLLMSNQHIRHLPVVEKGTTMGILTIMDVVKCIISDKEQLIEQLEHYIAG